MNRRTIKLTETKDGWWIEKYSDDSTPTAGICGIDNSMSKEELLMALEGLL